MKTDSNPPATRGLAKSERLTLAAVILAISLGVFQATVAGCDMADLSRQQIVASRIVERQLEKLRTGDLSRMDESSGAANAGLEVGEGARDESGFTLHRTVTAIRPDLKQVTLTVSWRGSSGRTYSHTGSTFVAREGRYVAN